MHRGHRENPKKRISENWEIIGDWAMMTKQQETTWRTVAVKRVKSKSFVGVSTFSVHYALKSK